MSPKRRPSRVTPRRTPERDLLVAVHKLTGLDPARVEVARTTLRELGIAQVERELLRPTIDAAVGATLLAESFEGLIARGVQDTKLLSKLRNDRDVWPTWAELRAARNLAEFLQDNGELQLEAARDRGRQADFRFSASGGDVFRFIPSGGSSGISVEFKAIGLSDEEVAFCQRAKPTLDVHRPLRGFTTLHAPLELDKRGVWMDDAARAHAGREAQHLARRLPPHTIGLSGVVVVAQGTGESYVRRTRSRLAEAFTQLPTDEECWVAFHWTNGAPITAVHAALETIELPPNLSGLLFVGSAVAFPHAAIHNFTHWGVADHQLTGDRAIYSDVDDELARLVLQRIEGSSGVRPCIVRSSVGGKRSDVLVRDGSQRILPFIFVLEPDPDPSTHTAVPIPT